MEKVESLAFRSMKITVWLTAEASAKTSNYVISCWYLILYSLPVENLSLGFCGITFMKQNLNNMFLVSGENQQDES